MPRKAGVFGGEQDPLGNSCELLGVCVDFIGVLDLIQGLL